MSRQNLRDLVTQSLLQESKMELQQQLIIRLRPFTVSMQAKSKTQLWDIKIHLLKLMQRHYEDELILSIGRYMLSIIDEQLSKQN